MKQGLSLRVSQHLALTPQLQQSISLLQLSTLELSQEIEQMLEANPFLEMDHEAAERELKVLCKSLPNDVSFEQVLRVGNAHLEIVKAAKELAELQSTVSVMRSQLEGQLHAAQSREQKLRAENENEANELRHTIRTLRSELEATPVKGTAAVETELAAFVAERRNLQNQIWAMRATLDVRV